MSTWADIQRLASDLQRVQLSAAAKKLSDSNCVEVMSKLISRQMIDVVFTRDGGAYVTKKHLRTEIQNECLGLGGRVSLTDLATTLNIDFEHVENAVFVVVQENDNFILSNGELFAKDYVNQLQSELRVLLAESGVRTQSSLSRQWDLPSDLLKALLIDQLPSDGEFIVDGDSIYTKDYLEAHKYLLRAILCAITKVTSLPLLQSRVQLPASRFFIALDELISTGEVPGKIVGSRSSPSATYVPNLQGDLVNGALKRMIGQNEFIQISQVKKMGISDAKLALKSALSTKEFENLVFLPSIIVTKDVVESQLQEIKDEVTTSLYADVSEVLHRSGIPFDDSDVDHFVIKATKGHKNLLSDGGYIYSSELLAKAVEYLGNKRAEEEMEKLATEKKQPQKKKVEEEEDWGDSGKGKGKKGGKGGKAKGGKGKGTVEESDRREGASSIPTEDIVEWLLTSEVPEDLRELVADAVQSQVTSLLRERVTRLIATQATANAQSHKRSHQQFQQQASQLYGNIAMFESALDKLDGPLASDLRIFLQKSICSELAHAVLGFASGTPSVAQMKDKQRDETIAALAGPSKDAVSALYASLKSEGLQDFHDAVFEISSPSVCSLNMKITDKKTKQDLASQYAKELLEQVNNQTDPAASLLSVVLYLLAKSGSPIHASGKYVSQLVPLLAENIDIEVYDMIVDTQKLVVSSFKKKDDAEIKEQLDAKLGELKIRVLKE